jgi:hypothetical protein
MRPPVARDAAGWWLPFRRRIVSQSNEGDGPMSVPREEHDAKIEALEARMDARMKPIELAIQTLQEAFRVLHNDMQELRKEMRENMRLTMAMFVTLLVAIVTTGITTAVAVHQSTKNSIDNMLAAFATGKSTQPTIQVLPHVMTQAPEPAPARRFDARPGERGE